MKNCLFSIRNLNLCILHVFSFLSRNELREKHLQEEQLNRKLAEERNRSLIEKNGLQEELQTRISNFEYLNSKIGFHINEIQYCTLVQ